MRGRCRHGRRYRLRTAVFAANDQMAMGLMRALHKAGRRIPQGVSVIGFYDIPKTAFMFPPLTTVRPEFAEMGRRCITVMLDHIHGRPCS
ncbi:substrate-binding domain-containing protein, partial [Promicromonospora sp. NPDC057138]|uniref:substrate-binding domain-containing protein n=1 Tax=Promicromonospora sp. NPDC057138 TaxID=3346031 RepID=UPI00363662F0